MGLVGVKTTFAGANHTKLLAGFKKHVKALYAHRHDPGGSLAHGRAFPRQQNTFSHLLYVLVEQTGGCAFLTFHRGVVTGFYKIIKVIHNT